MIVHKNGTPGSTASAHDALLSDVSHDDPHATASEDMLTLEKCTDVQDDPEISVSFRSFAFSSSLNPGRDLSSFWVVDSACSIILTAFLGDFVTFDPPSVTSCVGGVGVDDHGSDTVKLAIPVVYGQIIRCIIYALYTHAMSSRTAQRIGRLSIVSWMQPHCGLELPFR
jgi:hypothetical protein